MTLVEPNAPDRWRGERMKLWGVLLIVLAILAFTLIRHAIATQGAH
jgi:hypothetical protein